MAVFKVQALIMLVLAVVDLLEAGRIGEYVVLCGYV